MAEITPFHFPATGEQVRTVLVDGEPWFVGKDVTDVLGYVNGRDALATLPDRMRNTVAISDGTPGNPNRTVITESGVYRLVMRSNLPAAEAFQDWIAEEVVPSIRKTGGYSLDIPRTLPDALRAYATEMEAHGVTKAALTEAQPKAESWETLADASGDYSVREAAQILNRDPHVSTGQNRLFKTMHDIGWIDGRGEPYQRHVDCGRIVRRALTYKHPVTNEPQVTAQVRITAKGINDLRRSFGDGQLELIGGL